MPTLLAAIALVSSEEGPGQPTAMKDVALSLPELLAGRSLGRRHPFLGHCLTSNRNQEGLHP